MILDSCSNPAFALNQSLDFVRDLIGTNDASEFQCRDGSRPKSRRPLAKRKVAAVVGGSYSSVTVQVTENLEKNFEKKKEFITVLFLFSTLRRFSIFKLFYSAIISDC